ncbi:MAG: methylcrotonoyl-CoA carboxylase [Deltaproteobacteria bacterium]|nr:methylcrotonoyl-CoA carboxylase [Deltaproteobacteria bacterium]
MPTLGGQLNPTPEMIETRKRYLELAKAISDLKLQAKITESEGIRRLSRANKLPVEERISILCDEVIVEVGELAGHGVYETKPGANIRCLIAKVSDKPVAVFANDPSVKGGTYYPLTVKKHLRLQEIAETLKLPCIYLVDSGGAFLPLQDEIFPDKNHFGRLFFNQSRMSAQGIPQMSLTLGSATAGGAYIPALSDISIMVKNQGHIFLGGPPLVKAATGLTIDAESLGGAEVHVTKSGVADEYVHSEQEGLMRLKQLLKNTPHQTEPFKLDIQNETSPKYDPSEIAFFLGENLIFTREILARILDDSYIDEFKPFFGTSIVCGFARICGVLVGVIANNGILFSESAIKATHFIQYCNKQLIPLVFFQNIVGFMVGPEYEHAGIAKDGAKMVAAVSNSVVPKLTIIIGSSFGAGNYGMCGRAFDPVFLFAWPNARIGVMGGLQAANVLASVGAPKDDLEAFKKNIIAEYDKTTSSLYATARLWDDGIIFPEHTRSVLRNCLMLCKNYALREFTPSYRF